jgi:hypothetical protein
MATAWTRLRTPNIPYKRQYEFQRSPGPLVEHLLGEIPQDVPVAAGESSDELSLPG